MDDKDRKKKIPELFLTFLKIGAFTFGGGYAMIALLENEFVGRKKWLDKNDFLDMVAIAESTPGPIAINSATYIGYRMAGFFGALVSTVAVSLPSLIIIYVISLFFDRFLSLTYVGYAFRGIKACVVYLIAAAGIKMFRETDKTPASCILLGGVLALFVAFTLFSVQFSSIFFILICGVLGLMLWGIKSLAERRRK